jgi:hypothetical protein
MKRNWTIGMAFTLCAALSTSAFAVQTFNEDVVVTSPNKLGVGTGSPSQNIHLVTPGTGTSRFRVQNDNGFVDFLTFNNDLQVNIGATNVLRVSAAGNLGIGTNPSQRLHLFTNTTGSTRFRLQNAEGFVDFVTDNNQLQMWINNSPKVWLNETGEMGIGTSNPTTMLDVNGETKTEILQITGGSDLSETFDINADLAEPGSVVSIDMADPGKLVISQKAYDKTVAGIISGANGLNTGMRMGQVGTLADGGHPVALTGRVYCKVDATHAAIEPGDLLTTSNTPGHAMKVLDHGLAAGAIIGKAMTPLAQGEKGMVLVLVSLQ